MRNSVVLRLAGAAVLAFMAGSVMSSPATAFVGLSDKQADEISEFMKCKTYLLTDLQAFNADPDCGKGPVVVEYLGPGSGGGGQESSCSHDGPKHKKGGKKNRGGYEVRSFSQGGYEGGYCHEDRKHGKKPGKKSGGFHGGSFGGFGRD